MPRVRRANGRPDPGRRDQARGQAGQHPDRRLRELSSIPTSSRSASSATHATRPRPAARLARARTSRTARTLSSTRRRSTSRRRSTPGLIENLAHSASRGRARADPLRDFDGLDGLRAGRLLPARGQLVEPDDPRRLAAGDGVTGREGEAPRQGPDGLHRPALRHQVRLELAGIDRQARRHGRQARGR